MDAVEPVNNKLDVGIVILMLMALVMVIATWYFETLLDFDIVKALCLKLVI